MRTVATIEARMTSSRLPGKVLKPLVGKPMLQWLIERIRPAKSLDEIVVATSDQSSDDTIADFARQMGVVLFRGNLEDVLGRLTRCAETRKADLIVKLSGDNPLYHHALIDDMVEYFKHEKYDFLGTTFMSFSKAWHVQRTFPLGLGVALFPLWVLKDAESSTNDPRDRESVVKYMIEHPEKYKLGAFQADGMWANLNRPELRLTVDTEKDFYLMESIFSNLFTQGKLFTVSQAIQFLDQYPQVRDMNKAVRQKELLE